MMALRTEYGGPGTTTGSDGSDHRVPVVASRIYESPGRSAAAHWKLVGMCSVVCLFLALAVAVVRHPVYSASAQLYVGKTLSLSNSDDIPGLSDAADQIAQDYSRLITTAPVITAAAKALGVRSIDGTLSATEVPTTPQLDVTATGPTQAAATALAEAGSNALIADVTSLNAVSAAQVDKLEATYVSLEEQINTDNATINNLQAELKQDAAGRDGGDASQVAELSAQITDLGGQVSGDTLKATVIETDYSNDYSPLAAEAEVLQFTSHAVPDGSDRKRAMELAGVAGLVVGLLGGVAVASLLDMRATRRRRRLAPN